jgi:hypothetical protein
MSYGDLDEQKRFVEGKHSPHHELEFDCDPNTLDHVLRLSLHRYHMELSSLTVQDAGPTGYTQRTIALGNRHTVEKQLPQARTALLAP